MKLINDVWSFSRVSCFETCQRKFYYNYIEDIREEETSEAQQYGIDLENRIRQHYIEHKFNDTPESKFIEKYKDLPVIFNEHIKANVNINGINFDIQGYIDMYVMINNKIRLFDIKTAKTWSSWNAKKADSHGQVSLYSKLLSIAHGKPVYGYYACFNRKDDRIRILRANNNNFFDRLYNVYITLQGYTSKKDFTCGTRYCKVCKLKCEGKNNE